MGVTQRDENLLSEPAIKDEATVSRKNSDHNQQFVREPVSTCTCSACLDSMPTPPDARSTCGKLREIQEDVGGVPPPMLAQQRQQHLQRHASFGKTKQPALKKTKAKVVTFASSPVTDWSSKSTPETDISSTCQRHHATTNNNVPDKVSIHAICENGNSSVLKHLLGYFVGQDSVRIVNSVCSCGMTPLQISCRANHYDIVKLLLKHRADPMRSKRKRTSCLAFACMNQNLKLVKLLLQHGAFVDQEALVTASRAGHQDILRCLVVLQKPIRLSPLDKAMSLLCPFYHPHQLVESAVPRHQITSSFQKQHGLAETKPELDASAFSKAAAAAACSRNADQTVFKLLLGSGSTPPSRQKITDALLFGCAQNNLELVQWLAELYDLNSLMVTQNASLSYQETPLHMAVSRCKQDLVELLLTKAQLDVNVRDRRGITPLYIACARGFTEIATLLIDHGAKAYSMGPGHETPLHIAAQENHLECVELLLDQQMVEIDCLTQDQCTPLHLACQCGNTRIVQSLLQRGADIHAMTACQETPMIKASRMSHFDTIRVLVAHEHSMGNGQVEKLDDLVFMAQSHRHTTLRSLIVKCAR